MDHDLAFANHRLRPGAVHADRAKRLAAQDPVRQRVRTSCVVAPLAFYEGTSDQQHHATAIEEKHASKAEQNYDLSTRALISPIYKRRD